MERIMGKITCSLLTAATLAAVSSAALAGKADDTLNVGFRLQLQSLDTYYSPGREGFLLGFWVYDGLTYRDPNTFEFEPLLATAWRQVDDLTLEFDIRKGVKFHNGATLTAEDVAYTLNFMSKPENKVFNQVTVSWIDSVAVVGTDKVRIKAKRVTPMAMQYVAQLSIYPAEYYHSVGKEGMATKPVGTGPFKAEPGPNNTVVFTRFDDYFADSPKGKAGVKRMVYKTIPDVNTQVAELMTGGLDWAYYIPDDQADRLKRVPKLKVVNAETFRVAYLTLDAAGKTNANSPLKDLRVRQAINYAIDRESIVKNLMGGSSRVINSVCYPKQFGCTQDVAIYNYDVAKAKALLAEAGQSGGFTIDLLGYRNRQVAEAIIGNLRAVGITANLQWLQYPAAVQKRRANDAPMIVDDWGSSSINDVAAMLPPFFEGGPDDYSMDTEVTAAIVKGGSTNDNKAREEAYSFALKRIASQAYWVPLFTMPVNYVFGADLNLPVPSDEIPEFWRATWK
jgi:peptide/nickel transport system substrate-binding protein